MLTVAGLDVFYGDAQALDGVALEVREGDLVAIIGANGAGKTTLMRSISGMLVNQPNAVLFDGEAIGALPAPDIVARGIAMVPEGRKLFPSLSVEENLLIGRYGRAVEGHWNQIRNQRNRRSVNVPGVTHSHPIQQNSSVEVSLTAKSQSRQCAWRSLLLDSNSGSAAQCLCQTQLVTAFNLLVVDN